MDKSLELLQHLITQLTPYALAAGKAGYETALAVERVDCIEEILRGLAVFLAFLVPTISFTRWALHDIKGVKSSYYLKEDDELGFVSAIKENDAEGPTFCVGLFLIGCSVVLGLMFLTDVWAFVGIFYPQLALAHEVMNKVLGN